MTTRIINPRCEWQRGVFLVLVYAESALRMTTRINLSALRMTTQFFLSALRMTTQCIYPRCHSQRGLFIRVRNDNADFFSLFFSTYSALSFLTRIIYPREEWQRGLIKKNFDFSKFFILYSNCACCVSLPLKGFFCNPPLKGLNRQIFLIRVRKFNPRCHS